MVAEYAFKTFNPKHLTAFLQILVFIYLVTFHNTDTTYIKMRISGNFFTNQYLLNHI